MTPAPDLAARKIADRRLGLALAGAGLAIASLALGAELHAQASGAPRPAALGPLVFFGFLASMWLYGFGLHRVLFAPLVDPEGVPPRVRPWISASLTLLTWVVLAQLAGLVAGALR